MSAGENDAKRWKTEHSKKKDSSESDSESSILGSFKKKVVLALSTDRDEIRRISGGPRLDCRHKSGGTTDFHVRMLAHIRSKD